MGGKSNDDNSRKMVQQQEDAAAEARAKDAARTARINQGIANIKAMFHGGNTYGTRATTSGGTAGTGPTTRQVWVPETQGGGNSGRGRPGYYKTVTVAGKAATPGTTTNEQYVTGSQAGFGDDFYNKFKQGILDYYQPQVAEKYGDARDELTYRLARAGTLRSTVAADEQADLLKQNELRTGEVRSKADAAAADLKGRVANEEAKATSQLYATEDPEVASNQALASIRNITAEEPDLTPLGAIFDIAAIGGANYLKGADNAALYKKYVPGAQKSTTIVG